MRRGVIKRRGISPRWARYICVLLTVFVWGCDLGDDYTPPATYSTPVGREVSYPPEDSRRDPPGDGSSTNDVNSIAKCLTAKGTVLYGASWCPWTKKQIEAFGKSFSHIDYVECTTNKELCDAKGVSSFPTWIINGRKYSGYRLPTALADLAGCN